MYFASNQAHKSFIICALLDIFLHLKPLHRLDSAGVSQFHSHGVFLAFVAAFTLDHVIVSH